MRELRDRLRLPLEALPHLGGSREMLRKDFDRDDPVEPRIAPAIDLPHSADADRAEDLVGAEAGTGTQGHGGRARMIIAPGLGTTYRANLTADLDRGRPLEPRVPGHGHGFARATRRGS